MYFFVSCTYMHTLSHLLLYLFLKVEWRDDMVKILGDGKTYNIMYWTVLKSKETGSLRKRQKKSSAWRASFEERKLIRRNTTWETNKFMCVPYFFFSVDSTLLCIFFQVSPQVALLLLLLLVAAVTVLYLSSNPENCSVQTDATLWFYSAIYTLFSWLSQRHQDWLTAEQQQHWQQYFFGLV